MNLATSHTNECENRRQETLSRLGPYPRYPDFCTIQVDQRKGGPGSNMGHFADK